MLGPTICYSTRSNGKRRQEEECVKKYILSTIVQVMRRFIIQSREHCGTSSRQELQKQGSVCYLLFYSVSPVTPTHPLSLSFHSFLFISSFQVLLPVLCWLKYISPFDPCSCTHGTVSQPSIRSHGISTESTSPHAPAPVQSATQHVSLSNSMELSH